MTAVAGDIVVSWRTRFRDKVEVYQSVIDNGPLAGHTGRSEFRYRVVARNGLIVETGSEGYTRRHRAVTAALRHHPRVDPA